MIDGIGKEVLGLSNTTHDFCYFSAALFKKSFELFTEICCIYGFLIRYRMA